MMPDTQTLGHAGLVTLENAPVPLAGVAIDAEISAFCARVSVTQRYVNREDTPIETVYLFPLDESAAVCGFEAVIDGTLVVGEVRERDEAFAAYDDAIGRGDGAYLLDEERPDVFRASLGNLPPGKEVQLKLTYATELDVHAGALRFAIPTTVAPRYAPAEDHRGIGRPEAEAFEAPRDWRVPYGLNLTVRLALPGAISRVESPSHPIAVAVSGATATVSLAQRDAALDRDVVLSVEAEGLDAPQAWIERDDEGREAVAVGFVPDLKGSAGASEVVFLVDRSGSMAGTSIAEVRNALQLCLRSLTPGCQFNIVGFGSRMDVFSDKSRTYDDASLAEASTYVAALEADLGGTEILPALRHVLSTPAAAGLTRQVIVLTDGEVSNTDAVIALARSHRAGARIFTFGIGAGASHHLVRALARAGGGASEFIHPGERVEPKVLRQLARLLSPALSDVRVSWEGMEVTQAPSEVPPVFSGSRLLIYAFPSRAIAAPARVRLEAVQSGEKVALDVPVDPARAMRGGVVAPLAARARIRELEESETYASARGSRQTERRASLIRKEIVGLAMRYGLMSRETSYVGIERRETPVEGDVQLRRVPIALTSGWGALEAMSWRGLWVGRAPSQPAHTEFFAFAAGSSAAPVEAAASDEGLLRRLGRPAARLQQYVQDPAEPGPADGPMHAVVGLQRADGTWPLTARFAQAIGQPLAALEAAFVSAEGEGGQRDAWATALAVCWLELHAADAEDEWRMIADKARRALATRGALELLRTAAAFLRGNPAPVERPGG